MLRKFAYNKIFRTTGMLVLLFLLLVFPVNKEYTLEDNTSIKTSASIKKQEVFLLDKDGYVGRCKVNLTANDDEEYAKKLIELMKIEGKYENNVPNGFKALLPSDLIINTLTIKDGNITIDFSKEFYEINKENEVKAMEMIIFNFTTISSVKNVYINVDGKKLTMLPNTKEMIKQPLTRSYGINKTYNINNTKDASKVTVYYVNKNNSGFYYVPFTMVSNDNREKIKIIIDQLTSSPIYETNLMSFLNYNTKLLNYEVKDDTLKLNFNEYLFEDINTSKILEEVIYTITLSVRENYDVKEVVFMINDKEI
ncbi:MAG: GerMN domain-containing protein, partial [Bacilli bacterium]